MAALALLQLSGCEVALDAPNPIKENSMTVTALAVCGKKLSARVSWTEDINEAVSAPYSDNYLMWRMLSFQKIVSLTPEDSVKLDRYYSQRVAKDADVKATIGDKEYRMTYNPETSDYECDYVVKPGDRISISAKSSRMLHYPSGLGYLVPLDAHSTVEVPTHKASVEILDAKKIYQAGKKGESIGTYEYGVDSAVVFKLRLKSHSSGTNCYRIRVSSVSFTIGDGSYLTQISPITAFHSNDPLFYDPAITKSFGPWPAYTTDVFSDAYFPKGEYVVELSSRIYPKLPKPMGRYIEIELEPINRALMEYLSVLYRLRVATDSYFTEPVTLPSNIEGGVGIFGAIGKSAKIRYWLPGEEDPEVPPTEWKETETGAGR